MSLRVKRNASTDDSQTIGAETSHSTPKKRLLPPYRQTDFSIKAIMHAPSSSPTPASSPSQTPPPPPPHHHHQTTTLLIQQTDNNNTINNRRTTSQSPQTICNSPTPSLDSNSNGAISPGRPPTVKIECSKFESETIASQTTNNQQSANYSTSIASKSNNSATSGEKTHKHKQNNNQRVNQALQILPPHPKMRSFECHLENRELWDKFHELNTEMIITKSGR